MENKERFYTFLFCVDQMGVKLPQLCAEKIIDYDIYEQLRCAEFEYIVKTGPGLFHRSRAQNAFHNAKYEKEDKIIELVEGLGEICFPDHIDDNGNTLLILATLYSYNALAELLVSKFRMKCLPKHKNIGSMSALDYAALYNLTVHQKLLDLINEEIIS